MTNLDLGRVPGSARRRTRAVGLLEAIIFDVDGTLADTEDVHRLAFNHVFQEYGLDWNWTPDYDVDRAFDDYLVPVIKKQYNNGS